MNGTAGGRCGASRCGPTRPSDCSTRAPGSVQDWANRVVFFDLETTGLSGGAGTLAFLAGCGWFEGESFRVRQFFLGSPSGEQAMLRALGSIFDEASLLVTFNGRSFDVPLMETRWAFHRTDAASDGLPHFDMLPHVAAALGIARGCGRRRDGRGLPPFGARAIDPRLSSDWRCARVRNSRALFSFPAHGRRCGDRGCAGAQPSRPRVAGGRHGACARARERWS